MICIGEYTIVRAVLVLAAFAGLSAPVLAQVAAIDPNVSLANIEGVMSQCRTVASDPAIADSASGICISATRGFLATVPVGQEEPVQDLVVQLLELSQLYPECDDFDDEIAAAIRASAARLPENSELRPDMLVAAETIEACETSNLGAVQERAASEVNLG